MIYFVLDLSLTLPSPAPTMQPESSDGFASVGTILPEGRAALLPGGSFRFFCGLFRRLPRFAVRIDRRLGPLPAAGLAEPGIRRLRALQHRVFGAAAWAFRRDVLRHLLARFIDDFLRDRPHSDSACFVESIGSDQDLEISNHPLVPDNRVPCSRPFDPTFNARPPQYLGDLPCLLLVLALAELRLPGVLSRRAVLVLVNVIRMAEAGIWIDSA